MQIYFLKMIQHLKVNSFLPSDAEWQQIWVNIAWWHQAITWTNVDLSSKVSCGIHPRIISQKMLKIYIFHMSLKMNKHKIVTELSQWLMS